MSKDTSYRLHTERKYILLVALVDWSTHNSGIRVAGDTLIKNPRGDNMEQKIHHIDNKESSMYWVGDTGLDSSAW